MPVIAPMYRIAMGACTPVVKWWGRMEVSGLEHLPAEGPLLLAGNHDSYWDPVAIGIAGLPRRQIKALAKVELWRTHGLGPILDGMGQIPIDRGKADAGAMERAVQELRDGACIGIFPEGTRSQGRELRARSGLGRLAELVPGTEIRCVTAIGTTDIISFPRHRPRVRVRFFTPSGGGRMLEGESAAELGARLLEELRAEAPRVRAGRRRAD